MNEKDIYFQIIDIKSFDEDEDNNEENNDNNDKFTIMIFGIDELGQSISLKVYGFEPYFYIYIPDINTPLKCKQFKNSIIENLPKKYQEDSITECKIIQRKKFVGFSPEIDSAGHYVGNKYHSFVYLKFRSKKIMQLCSNIFQPKDDDGYVLKGKKLIEKLKSKHIQVKYPPELYESNIDPLLRFLHIRNIDSCGWISCKKYKINEENYKYTYCKIDITCNWLNVFSYDKSQLSKMMVASFDIEADSSHGDFPIAKKGHKKLAANVFDIIKKTKPNNLKSELKKIILEAFNYNPSSSNYEVEQIYSKNNKKPLINHLNTLVNLIENLFSLESGCFQVCFQDKQFKTSNSISFRYFHQDEYKYPSREIQIGYVFKYGVEEYELKQGDIIMKHSNAYKLIHNKEDYKHNTKGKIELRLKIYNKNSKWELIPYEDLESIHTILTSLQLQNIIYEEHIEQILDFNSCFEPFKLKRDLIIDEITFTMEKYLPKIEGDKVIQIGTVVQKYGEKECYMKHIITLNNCSSIEGSIIESYDTEREVIIKWAEFINRLDPDIIIGYNIFGFDYKFLWERAEELECVDIINVLLTRMKSEEHKASFEIQKLSSAGLGDNELYYINMPGRVQIDLYKIAQRDYKLDSYKLDFVSSTFINGSILNYHYDTKSIITTDNIIGLIVNNYISIGIKTLNGIDKYEEGRKFKILDIYPDKKQIIIEEQLYLDLKKTKYQWGLAKDDVSPKDIFRLQLGTPEDRAIIAKYCIMDCELLIHLSNKLDIITNNIGMANVCSVPLSFIFLRGQGIKIFSLVSKQCRLEYTLIPLAEKWIETEEKDGYEGAIVLQPHPNIYLNNPIAVLDYSSLYPSSMISENLSHDTQVENPYYLGKEGGIRINKMGLKYEDITYDNYLYLPKGKTFVKTINADKPKITCRYIQPKENEDGEIDDKDRGIIPRILIKLLTARKTTRKKILTEPDHFKKAVLDGLQLAYKVTANSLYGSLGAKTSPVFKKDIAASTTATGRKLLYFAKEFVEKNYPGSHTIYGDTDSVFISFKDYIINKHGKHLNSKELLEKTIHYGIEAGEKAKKLLKKPHDLEYEKTFFPFILLSKKRYVGNKYETDINHFKQTSMGIVLKRRDNAKIVKYIYGGIIDRMINSCDIPASIQFLKDTLKDLLDGKFPLDYLIITKTLKGYYKEPDRIAHKVLADRMANRDPGNKPQSNDRIPFVYIEKPKHITLQGEKIETPKFIEDNNLKIDYYFYITNQILKPVSQIYSLILESLPEYKKDKEYYKHLKVSLIKKDKEKANDKLQQLKMEEVKNILFGDILRLSQNKKNKNQEITNFFTVIKKEKKEDLIIDYNYNSNINDDDETNLFNDEYIEF